MSVRWEVDLNGAGRELDRLAGGPARTGTVLAMELALLAGYATSLGRVHVITGYLKSTGHPTSTFSGEEWTGTISFARRPGIFELWRGNRPTRNHPEGRHYFFDPGGPDFERGVREAVWDYITDGRGGPAPTEGLGPWSGG